jgi:hypothetical protein
MGIPVARRMNGASAEIDPLRGLASFGRSTGVGRSVDPMIEDEKHDAATGRTCPMCMLRPGI